MSTKRDVAAVAGVGAAACVACCAGPILGVLSAVGVGTFAGVLLFGAWGLLILGIGATIWWRRRRRVRCTPSDDVVVPPPQRALR